MFAARPPDRRLLQLLKHYQQPQQTRVLDLGCAGGRNTIVLADQGFDVYALDTSCAMVEKTRERLAIVLGGEEARKRVPTLVVGIGFYGFKPKRCRTCKIFLQRHSIW